MQIPRWLNVLFVLIAVNLTAVTVTSVWHLAVAQEVSPSLQGQSNSIADDNFSTNDEASVATPPTSDAGAAGELPILTSNPDTQAAEPNAQQAETNNAGLAPEIASPDDLPDLPAAEIRSVESDPIFQEVQSMFGSVSADTVDSSTSDQDCYFDTLENRLNAVRALTDAAQCIAREAQELQRRGRRSQSEELLSESDKLRKMAAGLLVREF